jgi:Rnl2 family RNA ligase
LAPYPKIPANARLGLAGVREWVALEKVHGAHFAVVCDVGGVRPAKRREILGDELLDQFFGVSRIWPAIAVAAGRFAEVLRNSRSDVRSVTIYGELAGGRYPHPDVPEVPGVQPVQTGVWYAPDLHWLLFDALVETPKGTHWISDETLCTAAAEAGLLCAPLLAAGPLHRVQELPRTFPTKVPAALGLPAIADNLAEGYVIKPAGEWPGTTRPVTKVKQDGFAEDARYAGARPYLPPPEGATGVPAWLVAQAASLLTPARAAAAVSKLGPDTAITTVAGEIAQDVVDEIAEAVGGLDDAQVESVRKALCPAARTLALFDANDRTPRRAPR